MLPQEGTCAERCELCAAGHGAIIHAATVEDSTLIGMGATILDGAMVCSWPGLRAGAMRTHSML